MSEPKVFEEDNQPDPEFFEEDNQQERRWKFFKKEAGSARVFTASGPASAIAGGGTVAAGGTVATLQSFGAVALAAGPAGVIVVGGAVVGAAVLGGTCYAGMKLYRWFRPAIGETNKSNEVSRRVSTHNGREKGLK
eukprot:GHVS01102038.1.p1 GENE.GHVS01102038.1~~GHVS01102038.1.p1  ORF type:complete len:136 (-),score=27.20 GHVS01102038.1:29-436(-)